MLTPRSLAERVARRLFGTNTQGSVTARDAKPPRPRGGGRGAVAAVERAHFELPGGTSAPGAARALLRDQLAGALAPPRLEDALVLVSELVMNSVLHAGAGPGMALSIDLAVAPERVRVEVCDTGQGFDPTAEPRPGAASGGLGMLLLHRIASSFGAIAEEDRSCVWFEIERDVHASG
ncbi:MAG: hypothetical protein NVSMB25_25550 [Thermoleophilaceae bacterium]